MAIFPLQGLKLEKPPVKSPDLNTIEKVWHLLKWRLTGRKRSRLELESAVREEWDNLLQSGVW